MNIKYNDIITLIQCAQRKWRTTDLLYTPAVDYELPGL